MESLTCDKVCGGTKVLPMKSALFVTMPLPIEVSEPCKEEKVQAVTLSVILSTIWEYMSSLESDVGNAASEVYEC